MSLLDSGVPDKIKTIRGNGRSDSVTYKVDDGYTKTEICYGQEARRNTTITCLPRFLESFLDDEEVQDLFAKYFNLWRELGLLYKNIKVLPDKLSIEIPKSGYTHRYIALVLYRLFDTETAYMAKFLYLVEEHPNLHPLQIFSYIHNYMTGVRRVHHFSDMCDKPLDVITGVSVAHLANAKKKPTVRKESYLNNLLCDKAMDLVGKPEDSKGSGYYSVRDFKGKLEKAEGFLSEDLTVFYTQTEDEFDKDKFLATIEQINDGNS